MSLESMKTRLRYEGGAAQQDRMIQDKLKSMLYATKYSYQAAIFEKYPHSQEFKGLFNAASQTEDRDTKKISCEWTANVKVGDVVEWKNTHTLWIVFLQDRTELAYFRGSCRRCDYKVKWVDKERKVHIAPVSVVGPSNPNLSDRSVGSTQIIIPTGNLIVLASNTPENIEYFKREQTFFIRGTTYKISQLDTVSMPGIIQINAVEYVTNLVEDDPQEELRNKWNVMPVIEDDGSEYGIEGPKIIKPLQTVTYKSFIPHGTWNFKDWDKEHDPMTFVTEWVDKNEVQLKWDSRKSGNFVLEYTANGKTYSTYIVVESLM